MEQQEYTEIGKKHTFKVIPNVTTYNFVVIGGGGGGYSDLADSSGGGGSVVTTTYSNITEDLSIIISIPSKPSSTTRRGNGMTQSDTGTTLTVVDRLKGELLGISHAWDSTDLRIQHISEYLKSS